MVINNFDFLCVSVVPDKTEAILIIDPDAELSNPVTQHGLETITWWYPQIVKASGNLQLSDFPYCYALNTGEPANVQSFCQPFGVFAFE